MSSLHIPFRTEGREFWKKKLSFQFTRIRIERESGWGGRMREVVSFFQVFPLDAGGSDEGKRPNILN